MNWLPINQSINRSIHKLTVNQAIKRSNRWMDRPKTRSLYVLTDKKQKDQTGNTGGRLSVRGRAMGPGMSNVPFRGRIQGRYHRRVVGKLLEKVRRRARRIVSRGIHVKVTATVITRGRVDVCGLFQWQREIDNQGRRVNRDGHFPSDRSVALLEGCDAVLSGC